MQIILRSFDKFSKINLIHLPFSIGDSQQLLSFEMATKVFYAIFFYVIVFFCPNNEKHEESTTFNFTVNIIIDLLEIDLFMGLDYEAQRPLSFWPLIYFRFESYYVTEFRVSSYSLKIIKMIKNAVIFHNIPHLLLSVM
jgi:hypothetical protein